MVKWIYSSVSTIYLTLIMCKKTETKNLETFERSERVRTLCGSCLPNRTKHRVWWCHRSSSTRTQCARIVPMLAPGIASLSQLHDTARKRNPCFLLFHSSAMQRSPHNSPHLHVTRNSAFTMSLINFDPKKFTLKESCLVGREVKKKKSQYCWIQLLLNQIQGPPVTEDEVDRAFDVATKEEMPAHVIKQCVLGAQNAAIHECRLIARDA